MGRSWGPDPVPETGSLAGTNSQSHDRWNGSKTIAAPSYQFPDTMLHCHYTRLDEILDIRVRLW